MPSGTPSGKKLKISVGFSPDTFERLAALAKSRGVPVSQIIRECVQAQLAAV